MHWWSELHYDYADLITQIGLVRVRLTINFMGTIVVNDGVKYIITMGFRSVFIRAQLYIMQ